MVIIILPYELSYLGLNFDRKSTLCYGIWRAGDLGLWYKPREIILIPLKSLIFPFLRENVIRQKKFDKIFWNFFGRLTFFHKNGNIKDFSAFLKFYVFGGGGGFNFGGISHVKLGWYFNSREEENTFIIQLDILRGIHADLAALSHEVSHLLGFQILVHLITCVIHVVMFGYFFAASLMVDQFYWPYLVLFLLPAVRIFLIGHWGQCLEQQVRMVISTILVPKILCTQMYIYSLFITN